MFESPVKRLLKTLGIVTEYILFRIARHGSFSVHLASRNINHDISFAFKLCELKINIDEFLARSFLEVTRNLSISIWIS